VGAPGTLDCHLWFGGPFERAIDRRWPGRPSEPSDQPPDRTRAAYERGISSRTPIYTSPLQNAADHGGENWGGRTRSAHGEQQFSSLWHPRIRNALAQQPERMQRVGVLMAYAESDTVVLMAYAESDTVHQGYVMAFR
jgi:hypothetical protein